MRECVLDFQMKVYKQYFHADVRPEIVPIKSRATCLAVLIISMHQTHSRWLGSQNYGITFKKKKEKL